MASISKRKRNDGSIAWQVQIRIEGHPSISKTFASEDEAKAFRIIAEERATLLTNRPGRSRDSLFYQKKFCDVIQEFSSSPEGKGRFKTEISSICTLLGHATMGDIIPSFIAKYIKTMGRTLSARGTPYSGSTIVKHLSAMSVIYRWYATDFDITPPPDLFSRKLVPKGWNVQRDRRLSDSEYKLIMDALDAGKKRNGQHWKLLIDLALETAARQSELILATWSEMDLDNFLWNIPKEHTKAKTPRSVPLSQKACTIIEKLKELQSTNSPRLFHCFKDGLAISMAFFFLMKKLNIQDLRFHDLRHEAISRMVLYRRQLAVYEIMKIVGHKSIDMLHRYANLRPEEMIARFRMSSRPY